MNTINEELRKVTAATTLCHLLPLKELERLASEARKKHRPDESKNKQGRTDHAGR